MPWHRIIFIFIVLFSMKLPAKGLLSSEYGPLIMQGLVYEEYGVYDEARIVYGKLFDHTGEKDYLFREVTASILGNVGILRSIDRLNKWDHSHPHDLEVYRLLIPLYLSSSQINRARSKAELLLEYSEETKDLELAIRPFLYMGEYDRVLTLLNTVYKQNFRESILLKMVTIMDLYTNERKEALQLLEMRRRMSNISDAVWEKILLLYSKENDTKNLLETYKAFYQERKDLAILDKVVEYYIQEGDISGAIAFVEAEDSNNVLLYNLYRDKKLFAKAYKIAKDQYKKTKEVHWLAESAIMLFEKSEDKHNKVMIKEVITLFDKALALGVDDSIYLNYYGYTLIDYDIDIDKGIEIIQNALIQQPNNTYYLDSLAWGYQKKHKCKEAYTLMKRVVDEEGLKIDEIKRHWATIQSCQ